MERSGNRSQDREDEEELERLFFSALEQPESERADHCERVTDDDPRMGRRLKRLLAEHLNNPDDSLWGIVNGEQDESCPVATSVAIPDRLGRYRILSSLGQGGMGTVYLAEQTEPMRRKVALKTLRLESSDPGRIGRLRAERQTLALLDHPNIAHIYDGGESDTGIPYFVMEYVEGGTPLVEYANRHELSIVERVELFVEICDAVEYGHQKGVLHRDLKPDNILVTPQRRPKLIDYGIARILDSELETTTRFTRTGELIGTIGYLSPEQCRGESDLIGPQSDVYALGVLLYELLTGKLPYEIKGKPIYVALRMIEELHPQRPSRVAHEVEADLDTITLKTLEKKPEHRFGSAGEMAADLRRYLERKPILARDRRRGRRISIALSVVGALGIAVLIAASGIRKVAAGRSMRALPQASTRFVKLTLPSSKPAAAGSLFGSGLAALGDLDGDGVEDLAVGAAADDDGGRQCGAVWILFLNEDGTVRSESKISATQGGFGGELESGDRFGAGMASLGDLDGDGVVDLAVGAADTCDGADRSGAIWILFLTADGRVKNQQKISNGHGGIEHEFLFDARMGSCIARTGDTHGDGGVEIAACGMRDGSEGNRGSILVMKLGPDGTVRSSRSIGRGTLGFEGAAAYDDQFGNSIACPGDVDGDGVLDLVVGAPAAFSGSREGSTGAVVLFLMNEDGTVNTHQRITAGAGGFGGFLRGNDAFGMKVATVGDLDANGVFDIAVAASFDDDSGADTGAVWLVGLGPAGTVTGQRKISGAETLWLSENLDTMDCFGEEIVVVGDLDGNGIPELAVSAQGDDHPTEDSGAVYILFLEEGASSAE